MQWLSELGRKIGNLLRGERFDRDLQDEMRLHLELRKEERMAHGLSPENARAAAQRTFGNATALRELSGDAWGWRGLERFAQDLKYGARALFRTPGFTALAVITLALGVGANTAVFSVVNAVLLRPLGYREPDRLVTLLHSGTDPVSTANYIDWREQSRSFEAMGAADFWSPNLTGADTPEHLRALKVTRSLLPMLGISPLLGRLFAPGEDEPGAQREVILSYRLWQRRFDRDPSVLGKQMILDGEAYRVVGVMPAEFQFAPFWATRAELWVPNAFSAADRSHRGGNHLRVFARLKQGVMLTPARAEVARITARLEKQYPATNREVLVTPLMENVAGKVETPLLMVLGAVGFVLLIACANVAHMLLARTSDREKEIAVRTALGAGRTRVVSQFLTENLLLAGLGAAVGMLFAIGGTKALVALSPAYLPRVETVGTDARVVMFLLIVTVFTTVVFGVAPAMHAAAGNLSGALKESGRSGSDGIRRNRLRGFLVASEFAMAFVLLIGAGLMIRSFAALQASDPGFNPHNVLSMVVSVAGSKEAEPGRRAIFYRQLLGQVAALPGVQSVGGINHLPLAGDMWGWNFRIEGRPKPQPGDSPMAVYRIAMPGYFETMRLPVQRGRAIGEKDDARAPGVVVISERAANAYWPDRDPIGQRIAFDADTRMPPTWLTVIGVVKNAKQYEWAARPFPEVYLAALQNRDFLEDRAAHFQYLTLVVRTSGAPADLAPAVKKTVWTFDRNLPVSEVLTMDRAVADATAQARFETLLLSMFAGVALVLATVGIYGVMNYAVVRRTREIGIRMSLGANRAEVLRMVMRQGMAQALTGSAAGLAGAFLMARLMTNMLYGVRPTDPVTFGAVAIVLSLAALAAICVPARKATRIAPAVALRNE